MSWKTVEDVDFSGKVVLLRADLNVSLDDSGKITDDSRIRAAVPTIRRVLARRAARVVVMSHLGRPDGKVVSSLRMDNVARRLQELLGLEVVKLGDCVGDDVKKSISSSGKQVFLLENLRFHAGEEGNDPDFAMRISELGEVYVNDAFGASHRAHASVDAITKYLPSCAGLLLDAEVRALSGLFNPERPFIAVLGGAKVSDKIGAIRNLARRSDRVLIGGAMAFTFLRAKGFEVGKSRLEPDKVELAKSLLSGNVLLPKDIVVASHADAKAAAGIVPSNQIPAGMVGLDIGPGSVREFISEIRKAKTIVWNGPMGLFEIDKFGRATEEIGRAIAGAGAVTVIGGGDTIAAASKYKLRGFTHISTGGGAMIEFLEGKKLPAIAALENSP